MFVTFQPRRIKVKGWESAGFQEGIDSGLWGPPDRIERARDRIPDQGYAQQGAFTEVERIFSEMEDPQSSLLPDTRFKYRIKRVPCILHSRQIAVVRYVCDSDVASVLP